MSNESGTVSSFVTAISELFGSPEDTIRLMISFILGYPLALFHRYVLTGRSANTQHLYHVLSGLLICYFNFGINAVHSIVTVVFNYAMLYMLRGTVASVVTSYLFNTAYLVIGFTKTADDVDYAITWTTTQCMVTLKLIGLALDLYDGSKKPEELSAEQKETARRDMPSLLQTSGYIYHYGGFIAGPLFSMKRYEDFVLGAYSDKVTGGLPQCIQPALKRIVAGYAYIAVYQISTFYLPTSYLLSDAFMERSFLGRCAVIVLWGKLHIYKYFGVWLLAEGSLIMCGMSYNGEDENKNTLWDACSNIHIRQFEFALKMNDIIMSFNVTTNKWMAKYLYKRLKWLGSKDVTQAITLCYISLWHGIYSGYFHNFFMEFIIMYCEKGFEDLYNRSITLKQWTSNSFALPLVLVLRKIYVLFNLSYALVSFCLFTYDRYFQVYFSVYCIGHIPFLIFPVIYPFLKRILRSRKQHEQNGTLKSH